MQVEGLLGSTWIIGWYIWACVMSLGNYFIMILTFFSALFMQDWLSTYNSYYSQLYDALYEYY